MKFSLVIVSIFFALNSIAQSVVVQPYLQNLTEQSVVVMWETEEANSWYLIGELIKLWSNCCF